MRRRRLVAAAIVLVVIAAGLRLAITPTYTPGYRVVDDFNIAIQVTGAAPTWRAVTDLDQTASDVRIRISEMSLHLAPGSGDERIAYVIVTLNDPLGTRPVIDASTGNAIPRLAP
jgi:hypothetical protein